MAVTPELNCRKCGNNRFAFPRRDDEPVRCEFCGESLGTLAEVKQRIGDEVAARAHTRRK